ncbi:SUMF1/EgtB/PvdO family nonheme iron enzyme [Chitinilyticum aquatile]|uniref:SUMF1/EgtB/PvdO family nonheme iron enzyme n=1 Tax=Chitinilyticum aquatile TaxID=362520 RepID=UPI00138AC343|nr:SUMF1/EgtB/PvdO family nonheme iron enzyme [Chitinilyticum aquatile]
MQESGYGLREQSPRFTGQPVLLYQPSAPGEQEAVRQAGEHQWKLLQLDLGLQSDPEEKIRLLRAYVADPHCAHFDEAAQQLKTLADELARQRQQYEAQQARIIPDTQAWQKTLAAVAAASSPAEKRAALASYAEQWEINRLEALAQISALDQIKADEAQQARASADAQAWQWTLAEVAATNSSTYKRAALKRYADHWENNRVEALAQISALDQIKADEAQQARTSADAQAWQWTLAEVAATNSSTYKRAALKRYADHWENNRVEALAQISALDRQIRDEQQRAEANSAAKAGHTAAPGACETFTVNGVSFRMVAIPAGSFMMGSPESEHGRKKDEGPQRRVNIKSFQLGQIQVTQGLWQAVMGNNHSYSYYTNSGTNVPVDSVSWDDAQGFIKKLNQLTGQTFRLPSEAEWEYAARAGCNTPFNVDGQGRNKIEASEANFDTGNTYNGSAKGASRYKVLPVASFAANGFGLYDMHGNLWEWVQDCYVPSYADARSDGGAVETVSCQFRVIRGGSLCDGPRLLRAANRNYKTPDVRSYYNGFRLARTLP